MRSLAVLMLIVLLLGLACHDDPISSKHEKLEIWPLAIGNEWHGTETAYDTTGVIVYKGQKDWIVTGDTVVNNETWYFIDYYWTQEHNQPLYAPYAATNKDDGFYFQSVNLSQPNTFSRADPILLFKYPVTEGEVFPFAYVDSYLVVSLKEPVETPCVKTQCIDLLQVSSYFSEYHYYIAPGIGPIKTTQEYYQGDKRMAIWELEEMILNPKESDD